jgi:hypothetical protein
MRFNPRGRFMRQETRRVKDPHPNAGRQERPVHPLRYGKRREEPVAPAKSITESRSTAHDGGSYERPPAAGLWRRSGAPFNEFQEFPFRCRGHLALHLFAFNPLLDMGDVQGFPVFHHERFHHFLAEQIDPARVPLGNFED